MWDSLRQENAHIVMNIAQAIEFEGDMGGGSVFYGWDSAWARAYGDGDDRPEDDPYD